MSEQRDVASSERDSALKIFQLVAAIGGSRYV